MWRVIPDALARCAELKYRHSQPGQPAARGTEETIPEKQEQSKTKGIRSRCRFFEQDAAGRRLFFWIANLRRRSVPPANRSRHLSVRFDISVSTLTPNGWPRGGPPCLSYGADAAEMPAAGHGISLATSGLPIGAEALPAWMPAMSCSLGYWFISQ